MMKVFCSIFVLSILLSASVSAQNGIFQVDYINKDEIHSHVKEKHDFSPQTIFRVYAGKETVDGTVRLVNFIDEVYLVESNKDKLVLSYLWEGEKNYLDMNYYLVPTDRTLKTEDDAITTIIEGNSFGASNWNRFKFTLHAGINAEILLGSSMDIPLVPGAEVDASFLFSRWFLTQLIISQPFAEELPSLQAHAGIEFPWSKLFKNLRMNTTIGAGIHAFSELTVGLAYNIVLDFSFIPNPFIQHLDITVGARVDADGILTSFYPSVRGYIKAGYSF